MTDPHDQYVPNPDSTFEPGWNYKLSPETLAWHRKRIFKLLLISGVGGIVLIAMGAAVAEPLAILGAVCLLGGLAAVLFWSAYVGGESLRRGGGAIAVPFVASLLGGPVSAAISQESDNPLAWQIAFIICVLLLAASVVGFFVMGWRANVPMWLLLFPGFFAPRVYIRGRATRPIDKTLSNKLDGRHARHAARDYDQ